MSARKAHPNILVFGDTHGYFEHVLAQTKEQKPSAVVFVGDIQPTMPLHKLLEQVERIAPVYFIHGNHDADTPDQERWIFQDKWRHKNLHGKVVEVDGWKLAGLGGVFRGEIWMPPNYPVHGSWTAYARKNACESNFFSKQRRHRTSIFPSVLNRLESLQADVLFTHEAPRAHPSGFERLDKLAHSLGVSHWFHGHHHAFIEYPNYPFMVKGVGFRGVCSGSGEVLLRHDETKDESYIKIANHL